MKACCRKITLDLEDVTVIDFDEIPFPGRRESRNHTPLFAHRSASGSPEARENTMALRNERNSALIVWVGLAAILLATETGCSKPSSATTPPATPDVEVVAVQQRDVPIYNEWIGTLDGFVNADIKAQVSGYLLEQAYQEGTFVKKGQLLFQIDPRPFQAALDQAQGLLAQAEGQLAQAQAQLVQADAQVAVAEANQRRTQLDVDRYTPLAAQQAITQQDLDNAIQNNSAAKAQVQSAIAQVATAKAQIAVANAAVQSAKAAVETARINLGFTRITSPIDGIPGIAQLQVGALVGPASPPITTVSTLDPIKVYFVVSEQEYLDFHRRYSTPATLDAERKQLRLQLILADGTVYPQNGSFYFADRQVDVRTGSIRIAGLFENPANTLRPGQYARIRMSTKIHPNALLVPQRAVTELQGSYQIAVVDRSNEVNIRTVKVGDRVGSEWIVEDGLHTGESVIVEGVQKIRQGIHVNPKPASTK
jgi:RND family efflux transporter MFP subunit